MRRSQPRSSLLRLARTWVVPCLAVLWLSCNGGLQGGDGGLSGDLAVPTGLIALDVQPGNDVLTIDLNTPGSQAFTATGHTGSGIMVDLTRQVTWTQDDASAGTLDMSTGVFHSAAMPKNGIAFTRITAHYHMGGVDLTGVANLTLVWLRKSGTTQDFFFVLPYGGAQQMQPLSFTTKIQSLDSFFAVDTTFSQEPAIDALSGSLQSTIIPGVQKAAAKDAWFGVGAVEDFPTSTYGMANCHNLTPDDQPFILLQAIDGTSTNSVSAVNLLLRGGSARGCGGDLAEGQMEALYQIATGAGNQVGAQVPAHTTGIGGVSFRTGSLPVITLITDATFHTVNEPARLCHGSGTDYAGVVAGSAHSRQATTDALNKICAKVVGVAIQKAGQPVECLGNGDLTQFAHDTGAVVLPQAWDGPPRPTNCPAGQCCTGVAGAGEAPDGSGLCPLSFKVAADGSGLGQQVVSGISQLARFASFSVVTQVSGTAMGTMGSGSVTLPSPHTTADFIKMRVPASATAPPAPPVIPAPTISGSGFVGVVPGSLVQFNIDAQNDFVMPAQMPQVFHATIQVLAGGCANLDERDVIILVPPMPPIFG